MGTWGIDAFENDDARDWVHELEETDSLDLVVETLTYIVDNQDEQIEAPECQRAVAAAEVLATLHDGQVGNITKDAYVWVQTHDDLEGLEHIPLAVEALGIVGQNSELNELWKESEEYTEWQAGMAYLVDRLKQLQNDI